MPGRELVAQRSKSSEGPPSSASTTRADEELEDLYGKLPFIVGKCKGAVHTLREATTAYSKILLCGNFAAGRVCRRFAS